jgi:hypothetical protein
MRYCENTYLKILTRSWLSVFFLLFMSFSPFSQAHHSFAVYDFSIQTEFKGAVSVLSFKNPHISMKINHVEDNGEITEIEFIEGAPANMLVRSGLRPNMIAVGVTITVIGSPLREDPTKFFIQKIILEDGSEF